MILVTRYFPLSVSEQDSPLLQTKFTLRDGPSAHCLDQGQYEKEVCYQVRKDSHSAFAEDGYVKLHKLH